MADSLNLSVAAALVMTRVLDMIVPEARGDMTEARRAELRVRWYEELRRRDDQRAAFEAALALPPAPFDDLRRPNSHRCVPLAAKLPPPPPRHAQLTRAAAQHPARVEAHLGAFQRRHGLRGRGGVHRGRQGAGAGEGEEMKANECIRDASHRLSAAHLVNG